MIGNYMLLKRYLRLSIRTHILIYKLTYYNYIHIIMLNMLTTLVFCIKHGSQFCGPVVL